MRSTSALPLLLISDLYHPPQDPDDQIDLATAVSLEEYDLRGVVLDVTRRFLESQPAGWDIPREPGYVPVLQLAHLTGRAIPVAAGPTTPLRSSRDAADDRPRSEQAGINLVLEVLDRSAEPVVIAMVGSARVLAAAYNREPELITAKTRCVLLNAGSTGGVKQEWNVGLDPAAYQTLWQSHLPIHWFPCATDSGAFDPVDERGTFWSASHAALFHGLPEPLAAWFCHGFSGNGRGDFIRALNESGRGAVWEHILAGRRNLWSTASLIMGAGRALVRTPQGWRFRPEAAAPEPERWPLLLDPIDATVDEEAKVAWSLTDRITSKRLFRRRPGAGYGEAMTEALNALLRDLRL